MTALIDRIARFPERLIAAGGYRIGIRESGAGRPIVLLHGIGSGAGSWLYQFEQLAPHFRVIAWDAPGYGRSAPITAVAPRALDYAAALRALVVALELHRPLIVAQSLGAIIGTAYANRYDEHLSGLLLLGPASGYGASRADVRAEKLKGRLDSFEQLGAARLAAERSANLLGPNASPEALELVRIHMAALNADGHAQAARLLAYADTATDARHYRGPTLVACGSADRVTPEAGCRAIAAAFPRATYRTLDGLGHASYVDGPAMVNALIIEFAATLGAWS